MRKKPLLALETESNILARQLEISTSINNVSKQQQNNNNHQHLFITYNVPCIPLSNLHGLNM